MQITIAVPLKADIVHSMRFEISVSPEGESWSKSQLGEFANKRGVYIHHSNGEIIYVGKATKGDYGKFGERLRRQFQYSAAGKIKKLHEFLVSQKHSIYTYFLEFHDVDAMVNAGSMTLSIERKALILEQVLIGIFNPKGNAIEENPQQES